MRSIRVLALASYPLEAAATRYRVEQYRPWLARFGIEVEVSPFLSAQTFRILYEPGHVGRKVLGLMAAVLRRTSLLWQARRADVILVQREAALLGPPLLEWYMGQVLGKPLILDLDDATFVSYVSPTYGRFIAPLKWFGKTDALIRWADAIIAGNQRIAQYVSDRGKPVTVLPTVVDTDIFTPKEEPTGLPTLGWIGSHSTFPFVKTILPVLEELGKSHRFCLKLVGGTETVRLPHVEVVCHPWRLDREVEDFRSLDIGLYPMIADEWSVGKSGFKAIQYMAVGIPTVASAVGTVTEIVEDGVTGFLVRTPDEWLDRLARLLEDPALRRRMGLAARQRALERFSLPEQAARLRDLIMSVADSRHTFGSAHRDEVVPPQDPL